MRAWLKDETNRPTQANNAFVRLRAFLNWCADRPEYRKFDAQVSFDPKKPEAAKIAFSIVKYIL